MAPDDMGEAAAALRAEWRAEEERWSRAALEQWEHGRTLADVARDSMHRGDTVTFAYPAVVWTGTLRAVGSDVARLDTGDTRVDLRLAPDAPFVLRTRPRRDDGCRGVATVTTFTARLRKLDGTTACIGTSRGEIEGTMRTGRDQVRITDGTDGAAYVPAASIWWVRPVEAD
jgi:hypothetical protein